MVGRVVAGVVSAVYALSLGALAGAAGYLGAAVSLFAVYGKNPGPEWADPAAAAGLAALVGAGCGGWLGWRGCRELGGGQTSGLSRHPITVGPCGGATDRTDR